MFRETLCFELVVHRHIITGHLILYRRIPLWKSDDVRLPLCIPRNTKTASDSNVYHITACLSKKYECDRNRPVSIRLRFQTLYINYFLRILNLKLLQSVVKCRPNQTMLAQYFPPLHIFECNCSLFALRCRENMKTGRQFRFFDGALYLRVPVERSLQPSEE